jgi:PAT family beta-lactamase induction signal transducer AmpG
VSGKSSVENKNAPAPKAGAFLLAGTVFWLHHADILPLMVVSALRDSRPLRYCVFFFFYVMQGLPAGFALTALANHLAARQVSAARIGEFVAAVGLPWAFQFVWGPVIDRFQASRMGARRPWVLLAQLASVLASVGIWLVTDPVRQLSLLSSVFFLHSIFASVQDASVDAMAISVIPENERGRTNACMRGGFLAGIGVGAAGTSLLLNRYGFGTAAVAQTVALLVFTLLTFFVRESRSDAWLSLGTKPAVYRAAAPVTVRSLFAALLRAFFKRLNLLVFAAVALVYLSQSVFIRAFSVHLVQRLHWADTDLSVLSGLYGSVAAFGVILVGGWLSDKIGAVKLMVGVMLVVGGFLLVFNGLHRFWGNPDVSTAGLVFWQTFDPAFSVAAMPLLMSLCRRGIEGSQFTMYMALVNLCDVVGAWVSGHAQRWLSAPTLGIGCGLLIICALATVLAVSRRVRMAAVSAGADG